MAASGHVGKLNCSNFSVFQEVLKQMRLVDDRVVYALNTSVPTDSFTEQIDGKAKCESLFKQLMEAHSKRKAVIEKCITETQEKVDGFRKQRQTNMDDEDVLAKLRKQQTTLRLMQSELMVEEVVRSRSIKIFQEKCRMHYDPEFPS